MQQVIGNLMFDLHISPPFFHIGKDLAVGCAIQEAIKRRTRERAVRPAVWPGPLTGWLMIMSGNHLPVDRIERINHLFVRMFNNMTFHPV